MTGLAGPDAASQSVTLKTYKESSDGNARADCESGGHYSQMFGDTFDRLVVRYALAVGDGPFAWLVGVGAAMV